MAFWDRYIFLNHRFLKIYDNFQRIRVYGMIKGVIPQCTHYVCQVRKGMLDLTAVRNTRRFANTPGRVNVTPRSPVRSFLNLANQR